MHGGEFRLDLETPEWRTAEAYYVPAPGFSDCTSERIARG
jgi:hypothetical protein